MLCSLDFYCTRPRLMDFLSELFRDISVTSTLFGRFHAGGPGAVRYPAGKLAGFHVVQSGECWLHTNDFPTVQLRAGDFVVLPRGSSRTLTDSCARAAFPAPIVSDILRDAIASPASTAGHCAASRRHDESMPVANAAQIGGDGPVMKYLCGAFTFAGDGARPLLAALPEVIHVWGEKGRSMHMLRDASLSISQVADRVGYASAAAFTAAFKRETGAAPGAWRREAATAA